MTNESTQQSKIKRKVKSKIPKDWLTEMRILKRISMETIKGIMRAGWVNAAIITTMAVALTVFGILVRASLSLSAITDAIGHSLELSVYLKDNINPTDAAQEINKLEHVKGVKIVPKDTAWKNMRTQFDIADIDNPLPNTLHVQVDNPQNIDDVSGEVKKLSVVESINYAKDIATKIAIIVNVIHGMILVVGAVSALFTITIINNTIHLVIQSRKEEIEIMRLMGVSNWYIKTPLILQGSIYGFTGTLVALLPLNAFQNTLMKVHNFFAVPSPPLAMNIVILIMFIMAIGFGAIGSFLSIKKYLEV